MAHQRLSLWICLVLLFCTVDDVINLTTTSQRQSDFYEDNEHDQTTVHSLTTEEEKLALEREIFKLLGLPDNPKSTDSKAPVMKRSAPKFLLDVYENSVNAKHEQNQNRTDDQAGFYFSRQDLQMITQSDVIISFTAQQNHKGAGGKPDRVKRIWFDVDAVPAADQMISGELRLYRGSDVKNRKNRGAFTIMVYRVLRTKDGERDMRLVDTVNTTAGYEGWITLNVTESLQHWMKHPDDNKGLYMSVHPIDHSSLETRPEDIGIVGFKGDAERQPFMAGFFKSTESSQARLVQSNLLKIEENRKRTKKRYASDSQDKLYSNYIDQGDEYSARPCKLHKLHVSFRDIEWASWIIAPEGYDADYCDGECKFPLNTPTNVTNHAIVQALVHLKHPQKVPKPCCVPTKLAPISVLYFLNDSNVVLKRYTDMVAKSCGCH